MEEAAGSLEVAAHVIRPASGCAASRRRPPRSPASGRVARRKRPPSRGIRPGRRLGGAPFAGGGPLLIESARVASLGVCQSPQQGDARCSHSGAAASGGVYTKIWIEERGNSKLPRLHYQGIGWMGIGDS
jgi:hypothetical protein